MAAHKNRQEIFMDAVYSSRDTPEELPMFVSSTMSSSAEQLTGTLRRQEAKVDRQAENCKRVRLLSRRDREQASQACAGKL